MKNGVRRTKLHQKHVSSLFLERHCVFFLSLSSLSLSLSLLSLSLSLSLCLWAEQNGRGRAMAMAITALSPHNVFLSLPNHHTHSCARSFSSASASSSSSSSSFHIASAPRALCRSVSCIDSASYDPSLLRRPHELKLSLRESLQGILLSYHD